MLIKKIEEEPEVHPLAELAEVLTSAQPGERFHVSELGSQFVSRPGEVALQLRALISVGFTVEVADPRLRTSSAYIVTRTT